jgi:hypothetical protein
VPDKSRSDLESKSQAQMFAMIGECAESRFQMGALRSSFGESLFDWLAEEFERGNHEPLRAVLQSVEEVLRNGGREVREPGLRFLQSLQEAVSQKACGIEAFVEFFGPQTGRLWTELNAVWRTSVKLDLLDRSVLEAEVLAYRISQQVLH